MKLDERLAKLRAELLALNRSHDEAVALKQRQDEDFRQLAARNNTRFHQLNGAIAELEAILNDGKEDKPDGKRK
jgi:hypothetical protein